MESEKLVIGVAIAAAILAAFICWKSLGFIPHIPDELSYLYQGRILASGSLIVEAPAVPPAFTVRWDHILRDANGWRSLYPPGWPLLLAIGWWIHAPWILNPILLGLSIVGVYYLGKELFDRRTALLALMAFVCSPFVLMMSAGFMAHPATLCFAVWCAFFLMRGRGKDFILAGATGCFAFAIRPYTAIPLLLPILIWTFWRCNDKKRPSIHLATGALPVLSLFFLYNHLLFGSMFRTGYSFVPEEAAFRGSLFEYFQINVPWYLSHLNRSLWGWPWPDLLIFVPLLFPRKNWKSDLILFAPFVSLLSAYSVFYYRDIVYGGPRYVYEAVPFLAILAARSMQLLWKWRLCRILIGILFCYPLLFSLPQLIEYHSRAYHGQSRELLDLVDASGIGKNALVLISGDPYVFRTFYFENSLKPANGERVFARDVPGMRETIVKAYPRVETWSMHIELSMVPGPNHYEDRADIRKVVFQRITRR